MSFKNNINVDSRNFYFAEGGNDAEDGQTLERANATINEVITKINALIPAPDDANPAAGLNPGFGSFSENFTIPEGTLISCVNSSITSSAAVTVTMSDDSTFRFESVVNSAASGDCVLFNNVTNTSIRGRVLTHTNTNSNCIRISGASDGIFVSVERLVCEGDASAGIFDESTSGEPRIYNVDEISLEGNSALGILFEPSNPSATGIMNIGSIVEKPSAVNGRAIVVNEGSVTMTVNEINATTAITINTGGTLNITASTIVGDIIVNGTGVLNANVIEHTGTLNIAGTSSTSGRFGAALFADTTLEGSFTASGDIEGAV